jgi:hypothetical protein
MIAQKQFTEKVLKKLLKRIPQFVDHCVQKLGDVIDIEYKSNTGFLGLYITTQDIEITIGFEDEKKLSDWHIHITTYDERDLDNDIESALDVIDDILSDRVLILHSNLRGYSLHNKDQVVKPRAEEIIVTKRWSEL